MKFFSFWRSLASFRVRIALNLKGLPAEVVFVDLDADAHRADDYRHINPQMALPALVRGRRHHAVPVARHPRISRGDPSRAAAAAVRSARPRPGARAGADGRLRGPSAAGAAGAALSRSRVEFARRRSRRRGGGTGPSRRWPRWKRISPATRTPAASAMAMRRRWPTSAWSAMSRVAITQQISLAPYPTVKRIFEAAMALPEFASAHPLAQPDTPEAMRVKR